MSPITHFLVGWVGGERFVPSLRDKGLIALAGVLPDVDGLGIVVDFTTRRLGWAPTDFYQTYHHMLAHGLPAALLIAVAAAAFARCKLAVLLLAFAAVHLHLLCDIAGSRGTTAADVWPIYYLAPFSLTPEILWSGQWPLVGWQNTLITVVLLLTVLRVSARRGYSPLGLFSARGDAALAAVMRRWFGPWRSQP
ncbi:MAG: metal-dependent hydrolase [Azonexus sp.]|jgi:hypothetical protein|nr:metal-dependent hydrolase [Azonexus sp.]